GLRTDRAPWHAGPVRTDPCLHPGRGLGGGPVRLCRDYWRHLLGNPVLWRTPRPLDADRRGDHHLRQPVCLAPRGRDPARQLNRNAGTAAGQGSFAAARIWPGPLTWTITATASLPGVSSRSDSGAL